MSDSNNNPGPPPDDFSKTVPNLNRRDDFDNVDWDKTNYNFPKQPSPDEWGKTVTNIRPIDTGAPDFGKTISPGSQPNPDWSATHAASGGIPDTDFGPAPGGEGDYGKTTPYFQLPEAERLKYQNLPPTPTEQAEQEEKEKQGGIPGWVWVVAGMVSMFMFAVLVLLVVYLWFMPESSFQITLRRAPAGSDVRIDDVSWGVTNPDGSRQFTNLKVGRRVMKIIHPSYECDQMVVEGRNGVNEEVLANCREIPVQSTDDCGNIGLGEEDKAERCYRAALEALPDPFTPEDLVKALNILIINFESGKYNIPERRLDALKKGAGFIQKLPASVVLEVEGHTDNVGSDASNQVLSENRANAVKDVLVNYGVRSEVLVTKGYGPARPKTTNDTELGKFYNRRIAYSILRQ